MTVTEIIPDDIPAWVLEAINEGQLWKTVFDRFRKIEKNRDYWRREYRNECKINEEWVKKHLLLVKDLLATEEETSLENHLFDLYEQFKKFKTTYEGS